MTDQGLKNYILDITLPEPFTLNDIIHRMQKHNIASYYYLGHYRLRPVLNMMVAKGLLTEKIGSEKRVHGSVTETLYTKVYNDNY